MGRSIDETPARELARFAARLREVVNAPEWDADLLLGDSLRRVVCLPVADPVLRADILLGFLECCHFSLSWVSAIEDLETDVRREALAGLGDMARLLDPMNFGSLRRAEILPIVSQGSLVPRLQLAAQLCREAGPDGQLLSADRVAKGLEILEQCTSLYSPGEHDSAIKQIGFEFHSNCRYVLSQSELFGRVGVNKTIERATSRLVCWRYTRESLSRADRRILVEFIHLIATLCMALDLRSQRGMSLATSLLINVFSTGDSNDSVTLQGVNINDVILDLLRDLTAPESAE